MMDDGNDGKDQSARFDAILEENRDLRQQMREMRAMMQSLLSPPQTGTPLTVAHTAATPTTSHSSIPEVPTPEHRRPPSSAVRSLSFRPPPVAPLAPSNPASFPIETNVVSSSLQSPAPRPLNLKVPIPDKFAGTNQEKATADLWLQSVIFWMRLTAEGASDSTLVMMFATVLKGGALVWFNNFKKRREAKGNAPVLQDFFEDFVRTYEGGLAQKMAEQKLNSLVYGRGECKDLTATENEFDRLSQELYPGAEESNAAISLLARIYSDIIRKGDEELWEKAMDAQPSTLDEWKAAVQNAFIVIETKKAHHRGARADRQEVRTTFYSRSSPSTSTSTSVHVKKAEHVEADAHRQGREESDDEAELQKAEVRGTSRPTAHARPQQLGSHLSHQQRQRLKELGKCWCCMERGHRAADCEHRRKEGYPRKPSAEDLKA